MSDCLQIEFHELLDLSLDGALGTAEARRLDAHLARCSACRTERAQLEKLSEVLQSAKIDVDPSFRDRVIAELGPTAWEARTRRSWISAVALAALFGSIAAVLGGFGAARLAPASSFLSALAAVFGLFEASLLAGFGLLGASWRGLGLGVQEVLSGSPANVVALAAVVLGCNLVFFRLFQSTVAAIGRKRASEAARSERD